MPESENAVNHQLKAYDAAYSAAETVPFPDHKIEGDSRPQGKTIVSIGGGTGSDIAHLVAGNSVYLVDYSSASAPIARAFGLQPLTLDLNQPHARLPFEDQTVDVLVLKDILEHLSDPLLVMSEMKRVLKNDGYMVISLPNHFNLWGRLRILFGGNLIWKGILHDHNSAYDEWDYMHIRFFTWKGTRDFIDSCELKMTRKFFDFGPLGHYFSVPMYAEHLKIKESRGTLTQKGRLFLKGFYPFYQLANAIFPEALRSMLCGIAPSVSTSCFYFHVRKIT